MLIIKDNHFKDGKTESVQLAQYDSFQTDKFYIQSTSLCSWKVAPVSSGLVHSPDWLQSEAQNFQNPFSLLLR